MTEQRRHEAPELGAAAARMMRALVERAAEGDGEALEQLAALEKLAPIATQLAGYSMNTSKVQSTWYSCGELAQILGISRQAAVKRFRARPLSAEAPHSWPMDWLTKVTSSATVMDMLHSQLTSRRAAS